MKTTALLIGTILITGALLLQGSGFIRYNDQTFVIAGSTNFPVEVKKIIDQKCYGCHSVKGQSQDAKDALMWDDLASLEKGKLVAKFDNIIEVLEDGAMPPEDAIKKFPHLKLNSEETVILKGWASAMADSLLN